MLGNDCTEKIRITFKAIANDDLVLKKILTVSHRWFEPGHPDKACEQTSAVVAYLQEHPEIEWVWFDFWCLPQHPRSPTEELHFRTSLSQIYLLFLGTCVLILGDAQYNSRFWTSYEAWLSMRMMTAEGLVEASGTPRCAVVGLFPLDSDTAKHLIEGMWKDAKPDQAYDQLNVAAIYVTNGRDKEEQLMVLLNLDDKVRVLCRFFVRHSAN